MSTNEQINNVMSIIKELIIDIAIFDGMKSLASKYENNDTFNSLYNNNAMMIVIRLSNIFGKDYEDNHWKKYIDDHNDFRNKVLYKTFEAPEKWIVFHNNLVSFRSEYCAHYVVKEITSYLPFMNIIYKLLEDTILYFTDCFNFTPSYTKEEIESIYQSKLDETIKLFRNKS